MLLTFLTILSLLFSAVALPTFSDFGSRTTIHSLVPDASHIHAFARRRERSMSTHALTLQDPAHPGNLTTTSYTSSNLASFYVFKDRLWVYRNESAIWPVSLVNATEIPGFPLQLVVEPKQFGVKQGTWSWWGTMLHYDHGAEWQMLFKCPMPDGMTGIFLYTAAPPAPTHCDSLTLYNAQKP